MSKPTTYLGWDIHDYGPNVGVFRYRGERKHKNYGTHGSAEYHDAMMIADTLVQLKAMIKAHVKKYGW